MPVRRPIVIAYHLVWTAYGTWLPNDPRGSGSRALATPSLAELGELHYGRRQKQPSPRTVRAFYDRAEECLQFPVVRMDSPQIAQIGAAFSEAIATQRYTCYACAIMPDHLHLVIRKHKHRAETMILNLQAASHLRLNDAGVVDPRHPIWTQGGWKSFLDNPAAVRSAIRYVEENPKKSALQPQSWPFVTPYDGWPLGVQSHVPRKIE